MKTPQASAGRPSSSLHFVVGEINGKMDQLIASLLPQLITINANHEALEVRVDNLEGSIQYVKGGAALLVFIVTAWEIIRVLILS